MAGGSAGSPSPVGLLSVIDPAAPVRYRMFRMLSDRSHEYPPLTLNRSAGLQSRSNPVIDVLSLCVPYCECGYLSSANRYSIPTVI